MTDYHGILVEEGLIDKSFLDFEKIEILGKEFDSEDNFTLLRIGIKEVDIEEIINLVQKNLRTNPAYYSHFYRDKELIVVFPDKIFRIATENSTWKEAIEYGKSFGIPEEQLTFNPCKFEDETY